MTVLKQETVSKHYSAARDRVTSLRARLRFELTEKLRLEQEVRMEKLANRLLVTQAKQRMGAQSRRSRKTDRTVTNLKKQIDEQARELNALRGGVPWETHRAAVDELIELANEARDAMRQQHQAAMCKLKKQLRAREDERWQLEHYKRLSAALGQLGRVQKEWIESRTRTRPPDGRPTIEEIEQQIERSVKED